MSKSHVALQDQIEPCRQLNTKRPRMGCEEEIDENIQQCKTRKSLNFQQAPTLLGCSIIPTETCNNNNDVPKKKPAPSIFRSIPVNKPFDNICDQKNDSKISLLHSNSCSKQTSQSTLKLGLKKANQPDTKNQFTLTSLRWRVQKMFQPNSQEKLNSSNSKAGYFDNNQQSFKQQGKTIDLEDDVKNDCTETGQHTCAKKNCIHCLSTSESLTEGDESPPKSHIRRRRTSTLKDFDEDVSSKRLYEENQFFIIPPAYSQTLLEKESKLISRITSQKFASTTSLVADLDYLGYGHFWYIHHREREQGFQPWQLSLSGKMEKLRLSVLAMYWESMKYHPISIPTIYVAISNFNRLLSSWSLLDLEHPTPSQWALTAVIAYRLAFKLEERPEILWEVNSFWDIFPIFSEWAIDRSASNMNKVEMAALDTLNDTMDIPLAPMFLNLYLSVGGWPEEVAKEYYDLAMYILGVITFASIKDHLLRSVVPSIIAIAALVLAIKIVNGDRNSPSGILPHLSNCPRFNKSETSWKNNQAQECSCRYEVYPDRLKTYCDMQLNEILPVIRGISNLLRSKPDETASLKHSFPLWGEHDWR